MHSFVAHAGPCGAPRAYLWVRARNVVVCVSDRQHWHDVVRRLLSHVQSLLISARNVKPEVFDAPPHFHVISTELGVDVCQRVSFPRQNHSARVRASSAHFIYPSLHSPPPAIIPRLCPVCYTSSLATARRRSRARRRQPRPRGRRENARSVFRLLAGSTLGVSTIPLIAV